MRRPSLLLLLLRSYVSWSIRVYCRDIQVINRPTKSDKSSIFASTHQNTLLDPLVIISQLDKIPFSLTRGDVFKGPLKTVFYFFRMRPVFRIRDGFRRMRLFGKRSFSTLKELFHQHEDILFFPEADNQLDPKLRPIKKGIIRVVSESSENPKVYAVRVSWDHPVYKRPKVRVEFSNPIPFSSPEELPKKLEGEIEKLSFHPINVEEKRFSIFEKLTQLTGLKRDFTGLVRWIVLFVLAPILILLSTIIYIITIL